MNQYSDYVATGNYCFFEHINIDSDGDGVPDTNLDTDNDGCPDLNIDVDGSGLLINWDTNGDGFADTNIDTNYDLIPDKNLEGEELQNEEMAELENSDHMHTYPKGFEKEINTAFSDLKTINIMIDPSHLPLDEPLTEVASKIADNLSGFGIDRAADKLEESGFICDLNYTCTGSQNSGKWQSTLDLKTLIYEINYYGSTNNLLSTQRIDYNTGQGVAVSYNEQYYAISNAKKMRYDVYYGRDEGVYESTDTNEQLWLMHEEVMNLLYFLD